MDAAGRRSRRNWCAQGDAPGGLVLLRATASMALHNALALADNLPRDRGEARRGGELREVSTPKRRRHGLQAWHLCVASTRCCTPTHGAGGRGQYGRERNRDELPDDVGLLSAEPWRISGFTPSKCRARTKASSAMFGTGSLTGEWCSKWYSVSKHRVRDQLRSYRLAGGGGGREGQGGGEC